MASGSDPYNYDSAIYRGLKFVFYWRSWFLFIDNYVHMTYPDLLHFSMHAQNVECIYIVYACMRDSSTALGQASRRVSLSSEVSVGKRCFLCISHSSPVSTTRQDAMMLPSPRIRSKGKGCNTCRVGISRKFRACAYVKCAPNVRHIHIEKSYD